MIDPLYWYWIVGMSFTTGSLTVIIPVMIIRGWLNDFQKNRSNK